MIAPGSRALPGGRGERMAASRCGPSPRGPPLSAIYCPGCKRLSGSRSSVGVGEIKYSIITTRKTTTPPPPISLVKETQDLSEAREQSREKRERSQRVAPSSRRRQAAATVPAEGTRHPGSRSDPNVLRSVPRKKLRGTDSVNARMPPSLATGQLGFPQARDSAER